jgi:hypothetical protein
VIDVGVGGADVGINLLLLAITFCWALVTAASSDAVPPPPDGAAAEINRTVTDDAPERRPDAVKLLELTVAPAVSDVDAELEDDDVADAVWLAWSLARVSCAVVTPPLAASTALFSEVGSSVARVCPAVTWSPVFTGTAATVPATGKDAATLAAELTVPTDRTTCSTEPVPAVAVR